MAFETGLTTGERHASLFQADTVMPHQYLETFRRLTQLQPEKRLMLAILEDGVACFQKYARRGMAGAKRNLPGDRRVDFGEPSEKLFSFANACETFGLDTDWFRQGLMRWKAAHLKNCPRLGCLHSSASRKQRRAQGDLRTIYRKSPIDKTTVDYSR